MKSTLKRANMKRILVLGYFGYETNQLDGQTVKTREVYQLIKDKSGAEVDFYDTEAFKKNKLTIANLLWKILNTHQLIYLPSYNNLKKLFPVIFPILKIKKIELTFVAIGGSLALFLEKNSSALKKIKYSNVVLVEGYSLKNELVKKYQLRQTKYFPNFRSESPNLCHNEERNRSEIFKIVFMGRIMEAKGVYKILTFAKYIKENNLDSKFLIDFYGPLMDGESTHFFPLVKEFTFVNYKGILQPESITHTLQNYDVMVLPTHYEGEGFPGTILDAYMAGIPVIVSNWKFIPEHVDHNFSGFIYHTEKEFFEYILRLSNDVNLLNDLKQNALSKSKEYSKETAWKILKEYI